MGLKEKGIVFITSMLILASITYGVIKFIDWVNEAENTKQEFIATLDECEYVQYRIDHSAFINSKKIALEEQRNLIMMGKCGGVNIDVITN